MGNAVQDTVTLCGCKTCVCSVGGYQTHITIENPEVAADLLCKEGVELIEITNFYEGGSYVEFITSKNYKEKNRAISELSRLGGLIRALGGRVTREKIESNPRNNDPKLYTEVHYKVQEAVFTHRHGEKNKYIMFFSRNKKGTMFATERFFGEPVVIRADKYVAEDVIYDTNLDLDWRLK